MAPPTLHQAHEFPRRRVEGDQTERTLKALERCLNKYGWICACCDMNFASSYEGAPLTLVHVHSLKPRRGSSQGAVVPVCPNCHAVIHSRKSPLEIKEVRKMWMLGREEDERFRLRIRGLKVSGGISKGDTVAFGIGSGKKLVKHIGEVRKVSADGTITVKEGKDLFEITSDQVIA